MNKPLHITLAILLVIGIGIFYVGSSLSKQTRLNLQRRGHPVFVGKQFGYILQDNHLSPKQTEVIYLDDKGQWHQQWFPAELVLDISGIRQQPSISIDSLQQQSK